MVVEQSERPKELLDKIVNKMKNFAIKLNQYGKRNKRKQSKSQKNKEKMVAAREAKKHRKEK